MPRNARAPSFAPTGELETPYQVAGQIWDTRVGEVHQSAKYWRWTCLGVLGVLAGSLAINAYFVMHRDALLVRYVEYSPDGTVRAIVTPFLQDRPTKGVMAERVRDFITLSYGLDTNPVTVRQQWLEKLYKWVTPRGAQLLNEFARQRDPFAQVGKVFIAVSIEPILPMTENTFDVRWTETIHDIKGPVKSRQTYHGMYTVLHLVPKTEQELKDNPLGIFIDTFSVTKTH